MKRNNPVFIIPAGKFPLFNYSSKKRTHYSVEKTYLFNYSAPQNGVISFFLTPLFLFTPKIEPGTVSLLESESTVILFVFFFVLCYRLVIQTKTVLVN